MPEQAQNQQETFPRQKISSIAFDRQIPPEVRLPALQLVRATLTEQEMQILIGEATGITVDRLPQLATRPPVSKDQELCTLIVSLIATCRTAAQRKSCIEVLRSLLPSREIQSLVSALASPETPVAQRIKELAENPSALAADIRRVELIGKRQEQIRDVMRTAPLLREAVAVEARRSKTLRDILSRRKSFYLDSEGLYKSQELGFEATRKFTAVFAAMCATESGRDSLRIAMDARNRQVRDTLWNTISANPNYHVPEVVVGSGPSAANYRSTIQTLTPDKAPLVIDAQGYGGGQFAAVVDGVFKLNSRARPYGSISRQNLPGTESPLNTQGPYCAVQESDLTSSVYGDQSNLGLAIEINHLLAGGIACNVALVGWNSFEAPDGKRRIVLALQRTDTGEKATMTTDRLVFARGLGAPRCAFRELTPQNESEAARLAETNKIVDEEMAIARAGGFARYRSFPQFMCDMGDRSNPFPLKDVKRVAIIGAGDSGNVTVEALLGYGPDVGVAPQELDRVEAIYWYGQQSNTKEEFEQCNRNRYVPLANEFPRRGNGSADYRVTPIAGKALALARTEDGRLQVMDASKREGNVFDLVIDCSGSERPSVEKSFDPSLRPGLLNVGPDQQSVAGLIPLSASEIFVAKRRFSERGWGDGVPTNLVLNAKSIARVTFAELAEISAPNWIVWAEDGSNDSPAVVSQDGILQSYRGFISLLTQALTGTPRSIESILTEELRVAAPQSYELIKSSMLAGSLLLSVVPSERSQAQEEAQSVARQPKTEITLEPTKGTLNGEQLQLGQKVAGEEVYIVGPETNLIFSDAERKQIQANFIAENIVAVFLYSGRITTLAEILAERGREGSVNSDAKPKNTPRPERAVVPSLSSPESISVRVADPKLFLTPSREVSRLLGTEVDPQAIAETFVRFAYRDCRPEDASGSLRVSAQLSRSEEKPVLTIQTSHPLPIPIDQDPVFVRACYLLLTRPPYKPNATMNEFTIAVPTRVRDGGAAEFAWNEALYVPRPGNAPRRGKAPGLKGSDVEVV